MKLPLLILLLSFSLVLANGSIKPYPNLEQFVHEGQENFLVITIGIAIMTLAITGRYFSAGHVTYAYIASALMMGISVFFFKDYLREADIAMLVVIELGLIILGVLSLISTKQGEA